MVAPLSNINNVFKYNQGNELFTSVEHYAGRDVAGCPLYFDVDFEGNLEKAHSMARLISNQLRDYRIRHDCFFSGSKGFHIEVPCLISGANAYQMAKAIKRTYFNYDGVDEHIYKNKALFRVENSINKKTGKRKTRVNIHSSLDSILFDSMADEGRYAIASIQVHDCNIQQLINGSYAQYKELIQFNKSDSNSSYDFDMPFCLKKMMVDNDPPRHIWHQIIYTISKAMLSDNIDSEDIIAWFDNHEFWGSINSCGYNRRSYVKVIRSLSGSNKLGIGCKNGLGADAMKHYCSPICPVILDTTKGLLGGNR